MDLVSADRALADTQRAFDRVAATYDRSNESNPILRSMRARARAVLERSVLPGARILDLGCGPGTDDVPLAKAGYEVTAIDWSAAMVDEARRRIKAEGVGHRATVEHLGIHQLDALAPNVYDAAYSNFGALNCVADLRMAANAIGARLRPHGILVASVIGRVCPWEIALYLGRGSWSRATLRFSRAPVAVPLEGQTVWTRYYSPIEFQRAFADAGFRPMLLRTLGLAAPPPYLEGFASRHGQLVTWLHRVDDFVGTWPVLRTWGDHFLLAMRRT